MKLTRALLRLERTMNLLSLEREGRREGKEGNMKGGGMEGREGGRGWREVGREGEREGGEGGEGGRGGRCDCYTYSNVIQWHQNI